MGLDSGSSVVKTLENVKCTITVNKDGPTPTRGLDSDFGVAVVVGGTDATFPALPNGGDGSEFEFFVKAPATVEVFTIKGKLISGSADLNTETMTVKGRPSTLSTVSCQGDTATAIRKGTDADCTITVNDVFGFATLGQASDFAAAEVVGGTFKAPYTAAGNGATMTFKVTAPASSGDPFSVIGKLSGGDKFSTDAAQLTVIGQPTIKSTLSCVGETSGLSHVRESETAICTVTARDDSGATTGFVTDFTTGTVVGGTNARELTSTQGGAKMTFKVTAPSSAGAAFTVVGKLAAGSEFEEGAFELTVVGTPSTDSTVVCVGADSGTTTVKVLEEVQCAISVKKTGGAATTALASDFGPSTVVGGTDETVVAVPNGGDGGQMTFTVKAPAAITTFEVTPNLAGNGGALNTVTLTVKGRPTTASTLICVSDADATSKVRKGAGVTCTITVRDDSGATKGEAADFEISTVGGTVTQGLTEVGDGSTVTAQFNAPSDAGDPFSVTVNVKGGGELEGGASVLTVIGQPTTKSTLTCVGKVSGTSFVRENEEVICTISVKDNSGATTGFVTDFALGNVVGGATPTNLKSIFGGAFMTFETVAPADRGTSFTVRGKTSLGDFDQTAVSLTVLGTPSTKSTVACQGDVSGSDRVTKGERVTCTITPKDSNGDATTAFASDFLAATVVGVTNQDVIKFFDAGARMTFTVDAPSDPTTAASVTGRLKAGTVNFDQGAVPIYAHGVATDASTLTCVGTRSQTSTVRVQEEVTCTIVVNDNFGATTALANSFKKAVSTGGTSVSEVSSNPTGSRMTFTVTSPSDVGATFTVTGRLADDTPFSEGAFILTVTGTPTAKSILACSGVRSQTTSLRVGEEALCIITVKDNSGPTTGVASDFASPTTVGHVGNAPLITYVAGGATMSFKVTAPSTVGQAFSVRGKMANGDSFDQIAVELTVVGTPTSKSVLSCVGQRSQTTSVRVNEDVDCVITVRDDISTTTAVAEDFDEPTIVGGSKKSPGTGVLFVPGGATMTFVVTSPSSIGSSFTIRGKLKDGNVDFDGTATLTVVGTPTELSTLACQGKRSGTNTVRTSEVVECTITFKDENGPTTGVKEDFAPATIVGGGSYTFSSVTPDFLVFEATAPSSITEFTIRGKLTEGEKVIDQAPFVVTVAGTPTTKSTLACLGVRSGTTSVRVSEKVRCTITVQDDISPTTGVASDYSSPEVVGGLNLSPAVGVSFVEGGATMIIELDSPPSVGATLSVRGRMANGDPFDQLAVSLVVVGTPTKQSIAACRGDRSQTTSVRVGEVVTCTFTVRDNQGTTTGVAEDFATPVVVGGTDANPASGVSFVSGGSTMTLVLKAPTVVGAPFTVTGKMSAANGGELFDHGAVQLIVVGTPTASSTVACVGDRSGTSFVRISEVATCTITVRDEIGPTTAVASDFLSPTVVGGSDLNPGTGVSFVPGGATMTVKVTAPNTVGASFSVRGRLAENSADFDQAPFELTVVGTPTVKSTISCEGQVSRAGQYIRQSENVRCILTVRDEDGPTTGVAADFATPALLDGTMFKPSQGVDYVDATIMEFIVTGPGNIDDQLKVSGRLAAGNIEFEQGPVVLTVVHFPDLVEWMIDMNNVDGADNDLGAKLSLTFRAKTDLTAQAPSTLVVVSEQSGNPSKSYTITTNSFSSSDADSLTRELVLTETDTSGLKKVAGLATETGNTFLAILAGSKIFDKEVNSDEHRPITPQNAVQAKTVTPDSTKPFLETAGGFKEFNLNTGQVTLVFNEPVDTSTFDATAISFGSSYDEADVVTLSDKSTTTSEDGDTVVISMHTDDRVALALRTDVCRAKGDCWLSFASGFVADMAGNEVKALAVGAQVFNRNPSTFVDDTTGPQVSSFSLDMEAEKLTIIFDEPVDTAVLDGCKVTLAADADHTDSDVTRKVSLCTGAAPSTASPDGLTVELDLKADDVVAIKSSFAGDDQASTFLSVGAGLITDLSDNENANIAVPDSAGLQAVAFTKDATAPTVISFTLNLATNVLEMTTSEPWITGSVDFSKITLQSRGDASGKAVTLTGGDITGGRTSKITVALVAADVTSIKQEGELANSVDSTFLSIVDGAFKDVAENAAVALSAATAMKTSSLTKNNVGPILQTWSLDMDAGSLTLTFDNFVKKSSFVPAAVVIQEGATGSDGKAYALTPASSVATTGNEKIMEITIGKVDLDGIKNIADLARDIDTSYIILSANAFTDIAVPPLNIIAVTDGSAQKAEAFQGDVTKPALSHWTLNVDNFELVLVFSETVAEPIPTNIVLQAAASVDNDKYALTGGTVEKVDAPKSQAYKITLTMSDANQLKKNLHLVTSQSTSYITFTEELVSDAAGNKIVAREVDSALQAQSFTEDSTPPQVTRVDLNLNTNKVKVTFDEFIKPSTLQATQITFQATETAGTSHRLTGGVSTSDVGLEAEFSLSFADANAIKENTALCTAQDSCFSFFSSGVVTDLNNVDSAPVSSSSAVAITTFVADTTQPAVVSVDFSLDSGKLEINYDEVVKMESLNIAEITLQDSIDGNGATLALHPGTAKSMDGVKLTLTLVRDDLNTLKAQDAFFSDQASSFVSLTKNFIKDYNSQEVVAVQSNQGMQVSLFTPDTTSPIAEKAEVSLNDRTISITFSESVKIGTLDLGKITLQNAAEDAASKTQSLSSASKSGSGTTVTITLPDQLLNTIKGEVGLASVAANTFLRFGTAAVEDTSGRLLEPSGPDQALPVEDIDFSRDSGKPSIQTWKSIMSGGTLPLVIEITFSETVLPDHVDPKALTLLKSQGASDAAEKFSLTGGAVTASSLTVVQITLTESDVASMRTNQVGLMAGKESSFLACTESFAQDPAQNSIEAIAVADAVKAASSTADMTAPTIEQFLLDLEADELTLVFSEEVETDLSISSLALQNTASNPSQTLTLATSTIKTGLPALATTVVIEISQADRRVLNTKDGLGSQTTDTFAVVTVGATKDKAGNKIKTISSSAAKQATGFIGDATAPKISSFELDMNLGQLEITFDEVIDAATIALASLSIRNDGGDFVSLTGGTSSEAGRVVSLVVALSDADLASLKLEAGLAVSSETSKLSVASAFVEDVAGNNLQIIAAMTPSGFTEDSTEAELVSSTIDLNTMSIQLSFNEPLLASSFQVTEVSVQSAGGSKTHTLADSTVSTFDSSLVEISLKPSDFAAITADSGLCGTAEDCFVAFTANFATDMVGVDVAAQSGVKFTTFVGDSSKPQLSEFSLFDLSTGTVVMTFSEPLLIVSVSPLSMTFQAYFDSPEDTFLADGATVVTAVNGAEVTIKLTTSQLNQVKAKTAVCTFRGDCYLKLSEDFATDVAGNKVVATSNNFPGVVPLTFTRDTGRPSLASFALNMNTGTLSLTFSETVEMSSLLVAAITIQHESQKGDTTEALTLAEVSAAARSTTRPARTIDVTLDPGDITQMKLLLSLASEQDKTFISFTDTLVSDTARPTANKILPIPDSSATRSAEFISDSTPPLVLFSNLDLDEGVFTFSFDEPVLATSLSLSAITLHEKADGSGSKYTLTGGVAISGQTNGDVVVGQLSDADLKGVKLTSGLAISKASSYIQTSEGLVTDTAGVKMAAIPGNSPIAVDGYIEDTSFASMESFALDFETSTLSMTFSDVVASASLKVNLVTLHDSKASSKAVALGQDSSTSSVDGYVIIIDLAGNDLIALKEHPTVATSKQSTFLSLRTAAIQDIGGRNAISISDQDALEASSFTPDTTRPELSQFTYDAGSYTLVLQFSEALTASSFNAEEITMQNKPSDPTTSLTLTSAETTFAENKRDVTVVLDEVDVMKLQKDTDLAVDSSSTFLAVSEDLVHDLVGQKVSIVSSSNAMSIDTFTPDTIRPTLSSFSVDMSTAVVSLTFSEVIKGGPSFNPEGITLFSTQSQSITLSSSTQVSDENSDIITLTLGDLDTNAIKKNTNLLVSKETSKIQMSDSTCEDMAGAKVMAVVEADDHAATTFWADTVPPSIVSVAFSLVAKDAITVTFGEPVKHEEFNVAGITVQDGQTLSAEKHKLSGDNAVVDSDDGLSVKVSLGAADLNAIKRLTTLATDQASTNFLFDANTVSDMNSQGLLAVADGSAVPAISYTADTDKPVLVTCSADLTAGSIKLTFSETVDKDALVVTRITLQSQAVADGAASYTLTGSKSVSQPAHTEITLELTVDDLNEVKGRPALAASEDSSYVVLEAAAVMDYAGNAINAVTQKVDSYIEDQASATLDSFDLDMNALKLHLTFSEPMNANSLDTAKFVLQSKASSPDASIKFSSSSTASGNGRVIVVDIGDLDANKIKSDARIGTGLGNSFLSTDGSAVQDVAGTAMDEISSNAAENAATFTGDTTRPTLTAFTLKMNNPVALVLTFSETVKLSTFSHNQIQLQNNANGDKKLALSAGGEVSGNSLVTEVTIPLLASDEAGLKKEPTFATSLATSWLEVLGAAIRDMNDNAIAPAAAIKADAFVEDDVAPQLVGFAADLSSKTILLTFDEVVSSSTLDTTKITLSSGAGVTHVLTSSTASGGLAASITVSLSAADFNAIAAKPDLLTETANSKVQLAIAAVEDTSGNKAAVSNIVDASSFVADDIAPTLAEFSLDLDTGKLKLTFSETVDGSKVNPNYFTLQETLIAADGESIALTGAAVAQILDPVITLTLSQASVNALKLKTNLAVSTDTTNLVMLSDAAVDAQNNNVLAIADGSAKPATSFAEDATAPLLTEFSFDLDAGTISITFNEPVRAASLDLTKLLLQSDSAGSKVVPIAGISNSPANGVAIDLVLSVSDLNNVKAESGLGVSKETTFLKCLDSFVTDMNGQTIQAADAKKAKTFVGDSTQPKLVRADLNMNTLELKLLFDESVASTVILTSLAIQDKADTSAGSSHTLQGGSASSPSSTEITVTLSASDANALKKDTSLAVSKDSTFITIGADFIKDTFGVAVDPVSSAAALGVTDFTDDTTEPTLLEFVLDLDANAVEMTFSETVKRDDVDVSKLVFANKPTNADATYSLSGGSVSSEDGVVITVSLLDNDADTLKNSENLATKVSDTFLDIQANGVKDMRANGISSMAQALQVTAFTPDGTPPTVETVHVDMNSNLVVLTFDKPIDESSVVFGKLSFSAGPGPDLALSGGAGLQASDLNRRLSFRMETADLNALKLDENRATTAENSDVKIASGFAQDKFSNDVASKDFATIDQFTADATGPQLSSWSINLNTNQLVLNLNEPVKAAVSASFITFQNKASSRTAFFTLTDGSTTSSDGLQIVIQLSDVDVNAIKEDGRLLTNVEDSFIAFTDQLLVDMADQKIEPVDFNSAYKAAGFVDDATASALASWEVNVAAETVTLHFPETMDADSLVFAKVALQASATAALAQQRTLTGGTRITTGFSESVKFAVNKDDIIDMKVKGIVASQESAWITMQEGAVKDTFGVACFALEDDVNAMKAASFTTDDTPPTVSSFSLSLRTNTISVVFDDPVDVSTFSAVELSLQSTKVFDSVTTKTVTLSAKSTTSSPNGVNLVIDIHPEDINRITAEPAVGTGTGNTHLVVSSAFIQDMYGNEVVPLAQADAPEAASFEEDSGPPTFEAAALSMDEPATLTLTFSETISSSSVDPTKVTLYAGKSVASTSFTLTGGQVAQVDSTQIIITLTAIDTDKVKSKGDLATSKESSHVIVSAAAVKDTTGNAVEALSPENAVDVEIFEADATPPELVSFEFDLNAETITLTFSETIPEANVQPTAITVQNAPTAVKKLSLSGGAVKAVSLTSLAVKLVAADLNHIKADAALAVGEGSTFITFTADMAKDTNNVKISAVLDGSGVKTNQYMSDTTAPVLAEFRINMDSGKITLTASETVSSDVTVTDITLASSKDADVKVDLGGGSVGVSGLVVTVTLLADDLNTIKSTADFATAADNSFILLKSSAIKDKADQPIVALLAGSGKQADLYTADATKPSLDTYGVDLDKGVVTFTFDESIDLGSVAIAEFTLQKSSSDTSGAVPLTGASVTAQAANTIVKATLGESLFEQVKVAPICNSINDCFLSITGEAVKDTTSNKVVAISDSAAKQATGFTVDSTRPQLKEVVKIDLNEATIEIQFNEAVDTATADFGEIQLDSFPADVGTSSKLVLSGSTTESTNGDTIVIRLAAEKLNAVKSSEDLCTEKGSCWVTFTQDFIKDIALNNVVAAGGGASTAFIQNPRVFQGDTGNPSLAEFSLDMDAARLSLTFDEIVRGSSFRGSRISIQNQQKTSDATESVTLTTEAAVHGQGNGLVVNADLNAADVMAIKAKPGLATGAGSTFLVFDALMVADMAQNPVQVRSDADDTLPALEASSFTADTTAPVLTKVVSYDANNAQFVLEFDEPVDKATAVLSKITIQSSEDGSGTALVIADEGTLEYTDETTKHRVRVSPPSSDLRKVRLLKTLALDANTVWIKFSSGMIKDLAANAVALQDPSNTEAFVEDNTAPKLLSFTANLDDQSLTLNFDDVVDVSTLKAEKITLQSTKTGADVGGFHVLTGGSTPSESVFSIKVILLEADANKIKLNTKLATGLDNTFLAMTAEFIADIYGTPVSPVVPSNALKASGYTADSTSPTLQAFALNMDSAQVTLIFSEAVKLASFEPTAVTLQDKATAVVSVSLSGQDGSASLGADGKILTFTIMPSDLNSINEKSALAASKDSTYITISDGLITDMTDRKVTAIADGAGKAVETFTQDTTAPSFASFSLDMNGGVLSLVFAETVASDTIDPTAIQVQSETSAVSEETYILTGGTASSERNTGFDLFLSTADLNVLKARPFATSQGNTYISFVKPGVVEDVAQNAAGALGSADAIRATSFSADTKGPTLTGLDIDMNSLVLTLKFDETVSKTSVSPQTITVQDTSDGSGVGVTLGDSSIVKSAADGPTIEIQMSPADGNRIKLQPTLAISKASSFVAITPLTAKDMEGNSVNAIEPTAAIQADAHTADTTAPQVTSFGVDFDLLTLTVVFDEPCKPGTLDATAILCQSEKGSSPSAEFQLTGGSTNSPVGQTIVINLIGNDVNKIKAMAALFSDRDSSFISVGPLARDTSDVLVQPIARADAFRAATFNEDATRSKASSFDLDLDTGKLKIYFPETMDVTTTLFTKLILQKRRTSTPVEQHRLSGGSLDAVEPSNAVEIQLVDADLNAMKLLGIGRTAEQLYLVMADAAVLDMNAKGSLAVVNGFALQVDAYAGDTTRPELSEWAMDMNAGTITMVFDESMDHSTLRVTEISVASDASASTKLTLSAGTRSCSLCTGAQFKEADCTRDADTQCTDCTVCTAGATFQSKACSATEDAECSACDECNGVTHFAKVPCSSHANTQCAACTESCGPDMFMEAGCSKTSDIVCKVCTACGKGEYMEQACTPTSDTVCRPCDACTETNKWVKTRCAAQANTECIEFAACGGDEFAAFPGTKTTDVVCKPCSSCEAGVTFREEACRVNADTKCTACTACGLDEFQVSACSTTADTVCSPCTTACPAGTYLTAKCSHTQDTQCAACEDANCDECAGPGTGQCLRCAAASTLQVDGTCAESCSDGSFPAGERCVECDPSCTKCSGGAAGQCTECPAGLSLSNGECVSPCPEGRFGSGCVDTCGLDCKLCTSASNCFKCADGSPLDNGRSTCASPCAPGTYPANGYCRACPPGCTACDATQCTGCAAGLALSGGTCVAVCPNKAFKQ